MTFSEYLLRTYSTENDFAIEMIKDAAAKHDDYRTLSLIFADTFRDKFERLWCDYETELDRMQYEGKRDGSQVEAYDLIGLVLDNLRHKITQEGGKDDG